MSTPPVVVTEAEIRRAIDMPRAVVAVREALIAAAEGTVTNPMPWHLDIAEHDGELHVKGAHVAGARHFVVKASAGYPGNAAAGLPTSSGLVVVFDAVHGAPVAVLLDGGHLTELRTGAAGAVAVDALAPADVAVATVIGTGGQARYQIEGLLAVRRPGELVVVGRSSQRAEALADWARDQADWPVRTATDVRKGVESADVVLTVTSSRESVVLGGWLREGACVVAVGSDSPGKRELDPAVLYGAGLMAADDVAQSRLLGELQGIEESRMVTSPVALGHVLRGGGPDRPDGGVAVADLTGLGAEDAAVAAEVFRSLGLGGESTS